jgi:Exostosin family
MILFYLYDDPVITINDWMKDIPEEPQYHLDKDLYEHFKRHPARTMDPTKAQIFIIGIPLIKAFKGDYSEIKKAIIAVTNTPFFKRSAGRDHLILADDWRLSRWDSFFSNNEFRTFYQNHFEHVISTRYEVYGKSKWSSPPPEILSLIQPSFFRTEWEVTRKSIIVPYKPYLETTVTPTYESWTNRNYYVFYHSDLRRYAHGATAIRALPINMFRSRTDCSIGTAIPRGQWVAHILDSKYSLVMRGDTPGSHAFINAISAGCIPVIISDLHEYGATPFQDIIPLRSYAIVISEKDFLQNPTILMTTLDQQSEESIRKKLEVLAEIQKRTLLNHPESTLCSTILEVVTRMI